MTRRAPFLSRSLLPPLRTAVAAVGALALAAGAVGASQAAPAAAPGAAATSAQVWLTTQDGSSRLARQADVAFGASPEAIDIRVDAGQRLQPFTGAGASVTEASASLIRGLPQGQRDALMTSLFSRSGDGIGLSYLRQPLGSTDFNSGGFYTYEDTQGQFSIDRDRQQILPVLQQARQLNPSLRFMGSPWSPPAWMKTNNSLNGGSLRTDRYQQYADYLVRAIQAYGQAGVPLSDLTVQNEPQFATSYPSMSMTSAQQADFLRVLDATLTRAGLSTNVLAYDHNWDTPGYPLDVLARTSDIDRVIGAAFHCYGGSPESQAQIRDAGHRVFFTECSGTDSATPAATFADSLRWQAENLVVRNMRSGGETTITWNLALNANGGPHQGHCDTRCNGVVEINGTQVTRGAEYYVLGHLTKFIDPGAVRVGSTSQGSGGVQNVVFQNPNGSRVAYVVNASGGAQRFSITEAGQSLSYSLPAGAVASVVWPGEPTGGGDPGEPGGPAAGTYRVVNAGSGLCVDGVDRGTANGTAVQQWACVTPTQANQAWRLSGVGGGWYQVVNQHANRALDVTGGAGATGDGVAVQLWDWTGGTNQQWRPEAVSGGYRFAARHSGKCLTVTGGATGNGARLSQQSCASGSAAQTFRLTAA
ncbi:RICIN domain-containing protein [Streptomyces sp. NPDC049881]|uniref:RICIN domain-containing protein n=1 Tax=Streptomyces sp. NPDC049881 TaxID=3155778 RepID=UPI003448C6F6